MTNHWIDYKNSDVFFVIGANPAENHPMAMKWIHKAQEDRGAKLIVADPRYTRTCASADIVALFRPGTDIPFLLGMVNYAITHNIYHRDYVAQYTNASFLVNDDFDFEDGIFTGLEMRDGKPVYNKSTWTYQLNDEGKPIRDMSLQHPRCVFQLLKKHVERYDIQSVVDITGCDRQTYETVCRTFCETGRPGKAGNIIYAMGVTQHSVGTQNVRAIAILQLMLGNMGIAGGGVNAQRGECNVQGSTDMAMLYHLIPGYMGVPRDFRHPTLAEYNRLETPPSGFWSNKPKFLASLLKAFYGEHATLENDLCYDLLPKADHKSHTHQDMIDAAYNGIIKGFFAWGQNPMVGGPNVNLTRKALSNLEWLVAIDIFETETAAFWKAPGSVPEEIDTEVFLLPACCAHEKEGSVTNSGRWIQWRYQAIEPLGNSQSDLWIVDRLFNEVRDLYKAEGGAFPDPILKMNWDYGGSYQKKPDIRKVSFEINGYDVATGKGLTTFGALKDDGSTAAGCWIYAGFFADPENPACKRRELDDPSGLGLYPNYSYAWPLNRRIVYNRCSTDIDGNPWDSDRAIFKFEGGKWTNYDVPDFNMTVEPRVSAANPFIMTVEGVGRIFSNTPTDGPLPEHFEPVESPIKNPFSSQEYNPIAPVWEVMNELAFKGDPNFPIIATTMRVTEHWQSGIMTRNSPALVELMPEMFVEISHETAEKYNISPADYVLISSPRGQIKVKAMVTSRIKPLTILGRVHHIIALPWHWGYQGLSTGASANLLVPSVGDANTSIPESKAFVCNIRRA